MIASVMHVVTLQTEKLKKLAVKTRTYQQNCCCSMLWKLFVTVKLGFVKQTIKQNNVGRHFSWSYPDFTDIPY